jgi:membrane associated rhomboid family serine protease
VDAETALPTCYRHGDRETRLSCSRCGRPVCVDCVRSAPVGQLCRECSAPEPGARVIDARQLQAGGLRTQSPAVFYLIATCVGVFLASFVLPVGGLAQFNPLVDQGQWWRVLTAAFLHDGPLHIMFNMYALYLFGPPIERQVGTPAFLALYVGSALAGGAAYYLTYALSDGGGGLAPAVGASGAIFGLFGAALVGAWRARNSSYGAAGFRQLLTLLAINLALPLLIRGIAWQAHVGGLVAGIVVAAVWALAGGKASSLVRAAAGAAVGLASLGVLLTL